MLSVESAHDSLIVKNTNFHLCSVNSAIGSMIYRLLIYDQDDQFDIGHICTPAPFRFREAKLDLAHSAFRPYVGRNG